MHSVEQVMTRDVITVSPETKITEVARILVEHSISGVPVVDEGGNVVGIVSEGDILVREAAHQPPSRRPLARFFRGRTTTAETRQKVGAQTARDAMTSPARTIESFRSIRTAAEIMTEHKVNRLPVVDEDGKLLGIVTRADLVRAFVQSDDELAQSIRNEFLIRDLWLDPDKFEITVDHGVAKISGTVIKRSTAEVIERLVTTVPGVLSAECHITWDVDDGGLTTAP
jgi:CBS-domain-containing membrane protein